MLKHPVLTSLATLSIILSTPACAEKPAARTADDADPALWVVKDKDTTVYLFGTIHVLKPGLTWFDEAVKTAFDASDQVMLEMVAPDPESMRALVEAKGLSPTGPTLSEKLPVKERPVLAKAVTDMGLPTGALERMQPWLAAVQLSVGPLGKQGYDAANGPEEVLTDAAKKEGKPVAGLETAAQQLGYFSGLSQAAQIRFLESTLDELPTAGATMDKMVDEWAQGRPDALAEEMNDSLKDSPEVARVLLTERNARWAEWVKARMTKPGTVFVAVGAGHLAGPQSVIAMLRKQGVAVKRINY